jgi:hypothetical protein
VKAITQINERKNADPFILDFCKEIDALERK